MPSRIKQLQNAQKRTTTPSDMLADLHIYIVPVDKWIPFRRLARNQVVDETVSAGFVRVHPTTTLFNLRSIMHEQLDLDIPEHYVFIRSVGRNFTQVKTQQEYILKVKHFLPPQASEPELHVLEIHQSLLRESGSVPNLILSDTDMSETHGSVLTGRISQVGLDGDFSGAALKVDSRLEMPPSYRERSRSVSNNQVDDIIRNRNSIIDANCRRRRGNSMVIRGNKDEDEENFHDIQLRNSSHGQNQSYSSIGVGLRAHRPKRSTSRGGYSRTGHSTQSSEGEEGNEERFLSLSRYRLQPSYHLEQAFSNGLHRSASLNFLSRPFSQESLPEEGDVDENGFRRSRLMDLSTLRGQRSLSVSALERKNGVWHSSNQGHFRSPEEVKKLSLQENRDLYAPHKWKQQREAKRKAKLMQKELEERREAIKAEEARKFEEQIKKEEEFLRKTGKFNKSERKTEILNLEEPRTHFSSSKRTDLTYPPEGAEKERIVGRRTGARNDAYGITCDTNISDDDLYEEEEYEGTMEERNGRGRGQIRGQMNKVRGERGRGRGGGRGKLEHPEQHDSEQVVIQNKNNIKRGNNRGRGVTERISKESIRPSQSEQENKEDTREIEEERRKTEPKYERSLLKNDEREQEIERCKIRERSNREPNDESEQVERGRGRTRRKENRNDLNKGNEKTNDKPTRSPSKGAWAEKEGEKKTHNFTEGRSTSESRKEDLREEERTSSKKLMSTPANQKKTASNQKDKNVPKENIEEVRKEKVEYEEQRTYLFKKARTLHEQILTIKEKRRQQWWENYNQARRKGVRLEERQANLRQELETLYRKVIGTLMKSQPIVTGVKDEPSRKASYKISVIRLRHEIFDLVRRVEAIDIKLKAEVRLRTQAAKEVKQLRSEVSRKKANVALSQSRAPLLRNIAYIPEDIFIRL